MKLGAREFRRRLNIRQRGLNDLNRLRLKMFVLFRRSRKQEGAGERSFSLSDLGDDVGAADPVGFGEIGGRRLSGMAGVRVVEAGNLEAPVARLAHDPDQLGRSDFVAVER